MPKKILLADDSITIQKVVELTFSDGDYEVIATNNGTKAIEALESIRPDIILSDIIMPEKNGYEVCEYVKSNPDLKHIPVILLTGTFEPFDPDRAEKAGCDAVVTKPFESQGLIQKVEQLIAQSAAAAAGLAPTVEEPSPPADQGPFTDDSAPAAPPPFETPAPAPQAAGDVFGSPGAAAPPPEEPADDGAPKLIPKMTFEDLQAQAAEVPSADAPTEAAPPEPFGASEPPPAAPETETPAEPEDTGATKMIPKMTFEDLQRMSNEAPPEPLPEPAPEPAAPFEEAAPEAPPEPVAEAPEPPPLAAAPEAQPEPAAPVVEDAYDEENGATKLIPKLTFDDIQRMREEATNPTADSSPDEVAASPPADESPFAEPAPEAAAAPADESPFASSESAPVESVATPEPAFEPPPADESAPEPTFEPTPAPEPAPEPTFEMPPAEEPAPEPTFDSPPAPDAPFDAPVEAAPPSFETPSEPEPEPAAPEPAAAPVEEFPSELAPETGPLSQEEIDRIARRVVDMMSDSAVKDVAWEVIPEVAEMAVKERIRELEAEED